MKDKEDKLVQKSKAGNKAAFGKLAKLYQDKVLFLAYDLVGDYDEAKDIAQDSFFKAYKNLYQFEERSKFSTWLYRITVNMAMDTLRKKQRVRFTSLEPFTNLNDSEYLQNHNVQPDFELENSEIAKYLDLAIEGLVLTQKIAVVLKFFHQKKASEIADILGCAENTARVHLARGIENIKKKMIKYIKE